MDNTDLNISHPLRIKRICSEELSGSPVTDKKVLKMIFQISTWCKVMLENIIRILLPLQVFLIPLLVSSWTPHESKNPSIF